VRALTNNISVHVLFFAFIVLIYGETGGQGQTERGHTRGTHACVSPCVHVRPSTRPSVRPHVPVWVWG
jgi:hypothetical protein